MYYHSKITIPSLRFRQVQRTHLIEAIARTKDYQIACLVAPAGYGKTTAAVQAALQSDLPAAWYSIDHNDNGLNRFWRYLILSLSSVIPQLEDEFREHLSQTLTMPVTQITDTLIGVLQNTRQEYLLILDEFNWIKEPAVLESLASFIRYLPANLHLLLISRSEPDLFKKRMGIALDVKYIRAGELRFSRREIAQYCAMIERATTQDELDSLMYCTEGWPAGTAMILQTESVRQKLLSPQTDFTNFCELLEDYFWEEILSPLGEAEMEFLIKTSVLERLTPALCDVVTGRTDSADILHELVKKNVPVESTGAVAGQFRYHKLFQCYLQQLLTRRQGDAASRLTRLAADWLEEQGHLEAAFQYIENTGEPVRAAEFIERNGPHLLRVGETTLLSSWLEGMPETMVQDRSMLCLLRGWIVLLYHPPSALKEALAQAEKTLKDHSGDRSQLRQDTIRAEILILRGLSELEQDPQRAMDLIREAHLVSETTVLFSQGVDLADGPIRLLHGILGLYGDLSRLDETMLIRYDEMEQIWGSFGYASVLLGEVLYEKNRLDEAYPILMQGLREAVASECGGSITAAVVAISRLRRARGDLPGALKIVDMGLSWLKKLEITHRTYPLLAWKTLLCSEAGQTRPSGEWIEKVQGETSGVLEIAKVFKYLVLARLRLNQGDLTACDRLLSDLLAQLKDERIKAIRIEAYNLRAVCNFRMGQTVQALGLLEKSLELGQAQGYQRSFADESIAMGQLLELYCETLTGKAEPDRERLGYARMLADLAFDYAASSGLDQCPIKGAERDPEQEPTLLLSGRELDVLRLIVHGLTNKEIAQELHVSLPTAKFHCSNIYKKLQVKNRQNAVLKASELGLFQH